MNPEWESDTLEYVDTEHDASWSSDAGTWWPAETKWRVRRIKAEPDKLGRKRSHIATVYAHDGADGTQLMIDLFAAAQGQKLSWERGE